MVKPTSFAAFPARVIAPGRFAAPATIQRRWLNDGNQFEQQGASQHTPRENSEGISDDHGASSDAPVRFSKPALREPPSPKSAIYVGNLFFDVTAEDLKNEFSKCGPVEAARIIYDPRGISRG